MESVAWSPHVVWFTSVIWSRLGSTPITALLGNRRKKQEEARQKRNDHCKRSKWTCESIWAMSTLGSPMQKPLQCNTCVVTMMIRFSSQTSESWAKLQEESWNGQETKGVCMHRKLEFKGTSTLHTEWKNCNFFRWRWFPGISIFIKALFVSWKINDSEHNFLKMISYIA